MRPAPTSPWSRNRAMSAIISSSCCIARSICPCHSSNFEGADLFIQDDRFIGPFVAPAHDMLGDLLQGLDFHGDVEPVDDMPRWTRQTAWQPLHNLRAIGPYRNFAAARVAFALKRLKRSEPQSLFRGVRRHEIITGTRAALSAATSSHRDLEAPSVRLRGASDVGCVNADNELPLGVIRQIKGSASFSVAGDVITATSSLAEVLDQHDRTLLV